MPFLGSSLMGLRKSQDSPAMFGLADWWLGRSSPGCYGEQGFPGCPKQALGTRNGGRSYGTRVGNRRLSTAARVSVHPTIQKVLVSPLLAPQTWDWECVPSRFLYQHPLRP